MGCKRLICSLPALYRSRMLHFNKYTRYPALKCLTPWATMPLCRILAAAIRCLPLRQKWNRIWRLSAKDPSPQNAAPKCTFIPSITGWTMVSKTVQVKGAGSQSFPAPDHIAPQCGPEDDLLRGQICGFGVVTGVMNCRNPHLSRNMAGSLLTPVLIIFFVLLFDHLINLAKCWKISLKHFWSIFL